MDKRGNLRYNLERLLVILIIVAIASTVIVYTVYRQKGSNKATDGLVMRLSKEEKNKTVTQLTELIQSMRNGNAYLNVVDGEDTEGNKTTTSYIFNSSGEAIAQDSGHRYVSIYRDDNKAVRFNGQVEVGSDIDLLKLMETSLELVNSKDAHIGKPDGGTDKDSKFKVYYVTLEGWDNIKKLYSSTDSKLADDMISNMKKSSPAGEDIKLRFKYIMGDRMELSSGVELVVDDKEYTLWYFDGYLTLNSWALNEEWYSNDFKEYDKATELLTSQLKEVDNMFKEYAKENNMVPKDTESGTDD